MDTAIFISRLFGFYLLIMGVFLLVKSDRQRAVIDNFYANPALVLFGAAVNLIIGLLIVLSFSLWVGLWGGIIFIMGVLSLFKGLVNLFCPEWGRALADKWQGRASVVWGLVVVLLGGYLIYHGYFNAL